MADITGMLQAASSAAPPTPPDRTPRSIAICVPATANSGIAVLGFNSAKGFAGPFTGPTGLAPATNPTGVAFNPLGTAVAFSSVGSPYVRAYGWSADGFGETYSNPSGITGIGRAVEFSNSGTVIAIGHETSPYISAYAWSSSGFGTRFSNPGTAVPGIARGVNFRTGDNAIGIAHNGSPYISAYVWSNSTGFGTKYANPADISGTIGRGVKFSPDGTQIAFAHTTSPYVTAYPFNTSTGFGAKYANPDPLPTGIGYAVSFTYTGDALAVGHATSPYLSVYAWTSSGFGSKFTNPGVAMTATVTALEFAPDASAICAAANMTSAGQHRIYPWSSSGFGTAFDLSVNSPYVNSTAERGVAWSTVGNPQNAQRIFAVANAITPYIFAYPWAGSEFGTRYANPAVLTASGGRACAFTPSGNAIVVGTSATAVTYLHAYAFTANNGFGTKYAGPGTNTASAVTSVKYAPDGDSVVASFNTAPRVRGYPWTTGSGFGTAFSNPTSAVPAGAFGMDIHPDSDAVIVTTNSTTAADYLIAYAYDSATGFGTAYANPATALNGRPSGGTGTTGTNNVRFSPNGNYVAIAHLVSPYVSVYNWNSSTGFGSKIADPSDLITNTTYGVAWNSSSTRLAVAGVSTGRVVDIYKFSSSGFGTRYPSGSLPSTTATDVDFIDDKSVGVCLSTTLGTIWGLMIDDEEIGRRVTASTTSAANSDNRAVAVGVVSDFYAP